MPYHSIEDLPSNVRDVLPRHAQEIYKSAFNSAYDEYKDPEKRIGGKSESHEAVAHKVAWAAVKSKYKKVGDEWVEKEKEE